MFEAELERIERQLKSADREQHRLLQWALKGFPEDQVEAENKRLNQAKRTLEAQKAEIELQLKTSRDAEINLPNLEHFIEDVQRRLTEMDNEGKRLALDMLGIMVWLDGENVEVAGKLDPGIVLTPLEGAKPPLKFSPPLQISHSGLALLPKLERGIKWVRIVNPTSILNEQNQRHLSG